MNQTPATRDSTSILESVLARGDLGKLTSSERLDYYRSVCQSIGLNPLTRPLEFISLQGKLTLYARRDAADQLRKINGVSIEIVERNVVDGLFVVHVRAKDASGRTDEDLGVVSIAGLKGEAAANAMLKGITKAKRRVTLSISGLGFLDETEVESIPAEAAKSTRGPDWGKANQARNRGDWDVFMAALKDCQSAHEIDRLEREYQGNDAWTAVWKEKAAEECEKYRADFKEPGAALTLREQLEGSLDPIEAAEAALPDIPPFLDRRPAKPEAPTTRAEYIQAAHDMIETLGTVDEVDNWWENEMPARRRFRLTPAEESDLKKRAQDRLKNLAVSIVTRPPQTTFVPNARERAEQAAKGSAGK